MGRATAGVGGTTRGLYARIAIAVMSVVLLAVGCTSTESDGGAEAASSGSSPRIVRLAFYAHYAPVSSSLDSRPGTAGFDTHVGYEADLLSAVEAMPGIDMTFERHGVDAWDGIWLLPTAEGIDMACGGITIAADRTRGPDGQAVRFTDGHIEFRQSLLVRAGDADRLSSYSALDGSNRVGVQTATTGESRLLQLIGVADQDGRLADGTRVVIDAADGSGSEPVVEATAGNDLWISPGGSSDELASRLRLIPADPTKPEVVNLDRLPEADLRTEDSSETQLEALRNGTVDAIAQGIVETAATAAAYGDEFVVSVVDRHIETGGCTVAADDTDLADRINLALGYLTDDGSIGFEDWAGNPNVFAQRAAAS